MDRKIIGRAIKTYMVEHGISNTEAAAKVGITPQALSSIITGTKALGRQTAAKFAEAFGFSETYLLTGDGSLMPGRDEAPAPRGGVYIPPELVQMFSDMAATIRSQQEDLARQRGAQAGRSGYHNTEGPDTSRQPGPH